MMQTMTVGHAKSLYRQGRQAECRQAIRVSLLSDMSM